MAEGRLSAEQSHFGQIEVHAATASDRTARPNKIRWPQVLSPLEVGSFYGAAEWERTRLPL